MSRSATAIQKPVFITLRRIRANWVECYQKYVVFLATLIGIKSHVFHSISDDVQSSYSRQAIKCVAEKKKKRKI